MSIRLSHHFLARRLHSLSGVIPIGVFLLEHFYTNFHAVDGPHAFNQAVQDLHRLLPGPLLPAAEVCFIGLPIAFHAIYGVYLATTMKNNVFQYSYARNWMYLLQRVTGVILVFFIMAHVLTMRFGIGGLGLSVANHDDQSYEIVSFWLAKPSILAFYILGIFSAAFHFANGLWSFAITWGLTVGTRAQQMCSYVCAGIGVVVFAIGLRAALAFMD